ncbi:MAG: hypothetical protein PVH30_02840 [Desulfobacterales bacterium]|jgi:hypothetical protein
MVWISESHFIVERLGRIPLRRYLQRLGGDEKHFFPDLLVY